MSSPILPIETHTASLIASSLASEALVYQPEHKTIEVGKKVVDGYYFNGVVYFNGARANGAW